MIKIVCKTCGETYLGVDWHKCAPIVLPPSDVVESKRPPKFDKNAYMREYMREWRKGIRRRES